MKFACVLLAVLATLALVAADSGYYSPRSYYRLDSNGNKGKVFYFNPNSNSLRRVRRQIFGGSSSSSSSSSTNGGPTYFSSSGTLYGGPTGYDTTNRFGGPPVSGVFQSTSGIVTPDGQVYYANNAYPISG